MKKIFFLLTIVAMLVSVHTVFAQTPFAPTMSQQEIQQDPTINIPSQPAVDSKAPTVSGPSSPQPTVPGPTGKSVMSYIPNPLAGVNSISDLIYKVVNVVVSISYVVVAFFLLLSGFKFITAQGNESKLEEAKKSFFHTIIGAALVIGAQVIVSILQGVFNAIK